MAEEFQFDGDIYCHHKSLIDRKQDPDLEPSLTVQVSDAQENLIPDVLERRRHQIANMGNQLKAILLGAAVVAIACTTIIALILSLVNHQTLNQLYSTQYGIALDAGSSHTALFLYQWLGNKENNTGIVSQKQSVTWRVMAYQAMSRTLQRLERHTFEGLWIHPKAGKIVGALDLGGASTQISFTPKDKVKDPDSAFNLQLFGYKYELYTHSYLCYGMDQALKKLQAYLHKIIVNLTDCALSPDCGFSGVYQPPVNGEFFAFSSYFYTFDFLGLAPKAPLTQVLSTIETHCNKNWTTLTAENPTIKAKYLKDYCASAHIIMTLLLKGYKFNTIWDQISFQKRVADTDIGWTLGYMLNLTNMIPSEHPRAVTGVPHSQWAAQIFFIVFALFLSLLIIVIVSVIQCFKS
ncbi:Ectonucleoside triphosphate diphosphohydrolase 8 [Labeo rohita]|uniref:Ectonucleoside triphosphate diphosphohydrolase 8 n=1 Tax=Labeo rohita TaxID=84645 RepID=A0ABQ8MTR8_LABRO|nr:Ectonucleoside triphosphate diphosphohydrolase 8 [Labeo rohita]